ncbi:MAG: hypothetical protein PHO62_07620 [Sulfurimonas sp.]|uniref:hypothetical protein n=1 Tax=Sulfurimonas sp. TaxID=2022749 RepID=UPI00260A4067|nr:hypothetical protein [Sulfurimonas sp.]MDD5373274.1 hypothetical protein [Sulfurimonas sp.]
MKNAHFIDTQREPEDNKDLTFLEDGVVFGVGGVSESGKYDKFFNSASPAMDFIGVAFIDENIDTGIHICVPHSHSNGMEEALKHQLKDAIESSGVILVDGKCDAEIMKEMMKFAEASGRERDFVMMEVNEAQKVWNNPLKPISKYRDLEFGKKKSRFSR